MKKITFDAQLHRIVDAYHRGLLNPHCSAHSFIGWLMNFSLTPKCGSLNNFDGHMTALDLESEEGVSILKKKVYTESQGLYELNDLVNLEGTFLKVFNEHLDRSNDATNALYEALVTTIVVLKQIHERSGETCYYQPITKADYAVKSDGEDLYIIHDTLPQDAIGGLLVAIFRMAENDNVRKQREHMQRLQREN